MTDDEVLRRRGRRTRIGPWTAQMYLMHTLARHDVWPASDLGVRHGWSLIHDLDELDQRSRSAERGRALRRACARTSRGTAGRPSTSRAASNLTLMPPALSR